MATKKELEKAWKTIQKYCELNYTANELKLNKNMRSEVVKLKAWAYKVEGKYTGAAKYKSHSTDIPCTITYNPNDIK